jgi:hypothetical protein
MKIKQWLNLAIKTFVNDCSIGLFLIILGFILGLCYNILWNFFTKLLKLL